VTDLDAAEPEALGAGGCSSAIRVLIDPAGHPFCLSTQIPDWRRIGEAGPEVIEIGLISVWNRLKSISLPPRWPVFSRLVEHLDRLRRVVGVSLL